MTQSRNETNSISYLQVQNSSHPFPSPFPSHHLGSITTSPSKYSSSPIQYIPLHPRAPCSRVHAKVQARYLQVSSGVLRKKESGGGLAGGEEVAAVGGIGMREYGFGGEEGGGWDERVWWGRGRGRGRGRFWCGGRGRRWVGSGWSGRVPGSPPNSISPGLVSLPLLLDTSFSPLSSLLLLRPLTLLLSCLLLFLLLSLLLDCFRVLPLRFLHLVVELDLFRAQARRVLLEEGLSDLREGGHGRCGESRLRENVVLVVKGMSVRSRMNRRRNEISGEKEVFIYSNRSWTRQ